MTQCKQIAEKLSGYIDGELTQQHAQQVRLHLESCSDCQTLHLELLSMQGEIRSIETKGGEETVLEEIMQDYGVKQSQHYGWMLIIIAAVLMVITGIVGFITSSEISVFEKIMFGLLSAGGILLFASVLKQRLIALKTDKYKDVNL